MFYSVFVLGKKGPLARVWLAAHWDKKITKAQILETNIVESVDSILQPRVKLSLRTSSHLLLGIVRIYARKTLYLLQDCQDAAFKIKSAFRPGAVDMPDGKTEAAISAITLPEMLDFINDFDLIAEPPITIDAPQTNANIRSITLVEDMSSIHVDDPLLNEVRDWADLSSVRGVDDNHTLRAEGSSIQAPVSNAHPLDIFDRPPADDGFGFEGDVDDMFALPIPPEAQEQMQNQQHADENMGEDRPLSRMSERSDNSGYSVAHSAAPSGPPSTPGSVPPPPEDEEMPELPPVNDGAAIIDEFGGPPPEDIEAPFGRQQPQAQAEAQEKDTMVLEPLEGPGLLLERGKRKRRKKLGIIIDEVKTLSGEEMKAQLSDTTDIVSTLDLAPPSKKLMHWKKTGGSEKLFALPERSLPSSVLFAYYSRYLITNRIEAEEDELQLEGDEELINGLLEEPEPRISRRLSEHQTPMELEDIEQMPPPPSPRKEVRTRAPKTPRRDTEDQQSQKSPTKKRRKQNKENKNSQDDMEKAPRTPKTPRADIERLSENHAVDPDDMSDLPQGRAGSTMLSDHRPSEHTMNFQEDEENFDHFEQPMSVGPPEEMMPDETAEQFEERIRNKRTNVLLRFMSHQLEEDGSVAFGQLVKSNRRKQVAQKFFSLLVLKKQQAIELSQDTEVEYGEISITKGPRYGDSISTSM